MRVNLLAEHKRVYSINWAEVLLIILVILLVLVLGLNYYLSSRQLAVIKTEVKNLDRQLAMILPQKKECLQLQEKIIVLEALGKEIKAARYYWDKVILDYGYVVPEKTMLQFLQIENNSVSLGGIAASNDQVIELIKRMQESPFFNVVQIRQLVEQGEVNFRINAVVSGGSD